MRCVYCDVIRKCTPNSPVQAKIWHENLRFRYDITETPNRPSLSICGQFTLRYTRVNAVSANQRRAKEGEIPDHLINSDISCHINRRHISSILKLSLCSHYSGWMSCLILFVWSSPNCEQREESAKLKMKICASAGNRTNNLLLSSVSL